MCCFWKDDHVDLNSRGGEACLSPKTVQISNKLCVQKRNGPLMTASCCRPHLSGWSGRSQRAANILWSRQGGKHSFHGQLDSGLILTQRGQKSPSVSDGWHWGLSETVAAARIPRCHDEWAQAQFNYAQSAKTWGQWELASTAQTLGILCNNLV